MKGPFVARQARITSEDGDCYIGRLYHVVAAADDRTEHASGLNRYQAQQVRDLLNRLDRRGIGRRMVKGR